MEKYIPKTNNRYVISDKGVVRNLITGKILSAYQNGKKGSVVVNIFLPNKNKPKAYAVKTLLKEAFELKPPDNQHLYILINKDDDIFNNTLDNLMWRIFIISRNKNFYPQPIYDENGKIVRKICDTCGQERDVKHFSLNKNRKNEKACNITYKNTCYYCVSVNNQKRIKASPELMEKAKLLSKKFYSSEKGKNYYKQYRKNYLNSEKGYNIVKEGRKRCSLMLTDGYLKKTLAKCYQDIKICYADIPKELVELQRKQLTLKRKIKHGKIKQGG